MIVRTAREIQRKGFLAVLLFLIAAAPPVRAGQDNVRCLRSIGVQPLQRLQFGLRSTSDSSAYVLYQGRGAPIPLKLLKVTEIRRVEGGRPSEFETQWIEAIAPESAGRYVYTNIGALIDDFQSIRKDGTIVRFVDDADVLDAGTCLWPPP
ncbi:MULTISPECIES: hypothetical protein [Cyanophyceae]|uniref:Uncharacterized protein n=1 Tax=Aphanothece cf. minutissima CCALA 015 TaxID=2107695 RepID=A0ABX5FBH9_9CHRO|nr:MULTISPECIES: hypothetical protein [Cyanophyceae]MCP9932835.1 hypothetical protein [Cyanobium sp. Candia 9D4]PSB38619.1 hypothetical protein C7B81_03390 [Aphanothece cf. minutissima CCALA 015]